MASKFKIGDRVQVVKRVIGYGRTATVSEVNNDEYPYKLKFDGIPGLVKFRENELELIPENGNFGTYSKATTANPKDLLGSKKVSITKLPGAAVVHAAHAMMNGADKYGAFNWRAKDVIASIYVDAAFRHLMAWFEREELAEDSGVHHLGHAIACAAILLDAQENGNLIDDRPAAKGKFKELMARLEKEIKSRKEAK